MRSWLQDLATAALAAAVTTMLWYTGPLRALDRPAADLLLRAAHRSTPAAVPVAVVALDDASVAAEGPLPWPRARLARLVEAARSAGAEAVVLDILLADPGDEAGDRALAQALGQGPAILAAALREPGRWLLPHWRFGGAERAAHTHAEVGPDGVVRVVAASKQAGDIALPALPVAVARQLGWRESVAPGTALRPDFVPSPRRIAVVSAATLMRHPDTVALAGRVALIGVTATGATDQFVVPTAPRTPSPGVLVHASAATAIAAGGLLRPSGMTSVFAWCLTLALATQLLRSRSGRLHPAAPAAVALGGLVAAALLLHFARHLAPPATMLAAVAVSVVARETVESRRTRHQADRLLASLVAATGDGPEPRAPTGAGERLETVSRLQRTVLRDLELRRTLLEGMEEGVVLWSTSEDPLLVNPAAHTLWGGTPALTEMPEDGVTNVLRRGDRYLEVRASRLGSERLGLLRDITAERQLEQRRREMQRLMSHELRTPLGSLAGFARMLERYELSREEILRVAGTITAEAERLGSTVTTFLDLERLEAGQLDVQPVQLELVDLVGRRLQVLRGAAEARQQALELEASGTLLVMGVPGLIERVLDNLVGNALKHPPPGTPVSIRLSREDGSAVIEVSDAGPGVPEEARSRLFERFFRGPGAAGGSGLGLAFAHEVVTWHGGCIQVDESPEGGARFTVRLPLAEVG